MQDIVAGMYKHEQGQSGDTTNPFQIFNKNRG